MANNNQKRFIRRESGFLSPEQIEDYRKDGIVVIDRFPPKLRKGNDGNANAGNVNYKFRVVSIRQQLTRLAEILSSKVFSYASSSTLYPCERVSK